MSLYRPVRIGSLALPGNLFLAPVAGYTDRAFRSICAGLGAALSFTELVSAEALRRNPGLYGLGGLSGGGPSPGAAAAPMAPLIRRGEGEARYGVQLFGADPKALYEGLRFLRLPAPDVVDLNAGCPVPKVVKTGAGAALMRDPLLLGRMVRAAVRASGEYLGGAPVTVKIRSGWDRDSLSCRECAGAALGEGAAMVSLHPRTRSQGYGGRSDWSLIADLVSRLPLPVTGSGDLYTPEDAEKMLRETGCAAVMFARGAMGNPFIFPTTRSFLETGAWQAVDFSRRIAAAFRHLELLAGDLGERRACLEMRKQFCAYTKGFAGGSGLPGGARLRNRLVHAESIAEYRALFGFGGKEIGDEEGNPPFSRRQQGQNMNSEPSACPP
jgi:nifR3 family TIM-barrel protein